MLRANPDDCRSETFARDCELSTRGTCRTNSPRGLYHRSRLLHGAVPARALGGCVHCESTRFPRRGTATELSERRSAAQRGVGDTRCVSLSRFTRGTRERVQGRDARVRRTGVHVTDYRSEMSRD